MITTLLHYTPFSECHYLMTVNITTVRTLVVYENQKRPQTRLEWYQTSLELVKYRQYGQQEDAHEFLVAY